MYIVIVSKIGDANVYIAGIDNVIISVSLDDIKNTHSNTLLTSLKIVDCVCLIVEQHQILSVHLY